MASTQLDGLVESITQLERTNVPVVLESGPFQSLHSVPIQLQSTFYPISHFILEVKALHDNIIYQ